jgi:hypothetical protein
MAIEVPVFRTEKLTLFKARSAASTAPQPLSASHCWSRSGPVPFVSIGDARVYSSSSPPPLTPPLIKPLHAGSANGDRSGARGSRPRDCFVIVGRVEEEGGGRDRGKRGSTMTCPRVKGPVPRDVTRAIRAFNTNTRLSCRCRGNELRGPIDRRHSSRDDRLTIDDGSTLGHCLL